MTFLLHKNLACKDLIIDLPLCRVLLENERHYPWIFLVPRRNNVSRITELSSHDQLQLLVELDAAQKVLLKLFDPTQLNVAAIGNKTPQLHVHVIARMSTDPAWPATVWDHPLRAPYEERQKTDTIDMLRRAFDELFPTKSLLK